MTYQLYPTEAFHKAFNRIAAEETAYAVQQLQDNGPQAEAIHQTRKAIKRLRALLRLARPSMEDERFKLENRRLRDAAASLSGARDAEVMLATLDSLRQHSTPKKFDALTEGFHQWLLQRRKQAIKRLDAAALQKTITELQQAQTDLATLKLVKRKGHGLQAGLMSMYKNGRRNFTNAYHGDDPEAFHEYRKSVQLYHRHMQLLYHVWPELLEVYVNTSKQLANILGDEHDLSVLHEAVQSHQKLFPNKGKMELLIGLIEAQQEKLQSEAFVDGRRLFLSEKPKAFTGRMISYLEDSALKPDDI